MNTNISKNKKGKKDSKIAFTINLYYLFAVLLLVLTFLNVSIYLGAIHKKVLGAQTQNYEGVFWYNFLQKNPSYIPGWIEVGRPDKVYLIDPNYF